MNVIYNIYKNCSWRVGWWGCDPLEKIQGRPTGCKVITQPAGGEGEGGGG